MPLTPKEEAIHLEVRALLEFKPADQESKYIYSKACEEFFDSWTKEILSILDQHLSSKAKTNLERMIVDASTNGERVN